MINTLLVALLCAVQDPRVEKDVPVPMRDGLRLATDVYLPAGPGPFPVVLCRTPYNKDGERGNAAYFQKNGYAYVAQDTRGRYKSDGEWAFLRDDGRDGADCIAWVARQPWCSGKIGMIGTSYVGGTQHAAAMEKPEALTTAIPVDAVSNMGRQSMRNAGAFELRFWNWIMLQSAKGSRASRDPATQAVLQEMSDHRLKYLPHLPLRRGTTPLALAPEYEDWLIEAMRHGANDAFWEAAAVVDHPERYKDMPLLIVCGWYDSWAGNSTANYLALAPRFKNPVH
ncbi:MAG TPA: CocE/NonD family hydrolase, partial [Planctomycetota bacterium]|nr:CocE/NonD family hydrolase [Planctomycetota bacterium]